MRPEAHQRKALFEHLMGPRISAPFYFNKEMSHWIIAFDRDTADWQVLYDYDRMELKLKFFYEQRNGQGGLQINC